MMRTVVACAAVAMMLATSAALALDWGTDFQGALKKAKEDNKLVLASFSGSDWCGWCIKLDKEVFEKPVFEAYASKTFVLFQADFPMHTKQAAELKKQNDQLAEKYAVQGFPTVLLLDGDGTVVARTGYQSGGPKKYIEHLKSLVDKK